MRLLPQEIPALHDARLAGPGLMTPGEAARQAFADVTPAARDRVGLQQLYEQLGGQYHGGTKAILDLLGWERTEKNYRRIQRYRTQAKEKRNPDPQIRELLDAASRQNTIGRMARRGISVSFDGIVCVSADCRHRVKDVTIDPDNDRLPELLAAYRMGDEDALGKAFQGAFFEAWGPGLGSASISDVDGLSFASG